MGIGTSTVGDSHELDAPRAIDVVESIGLEERGAGDTYAELNKPDGISAPTREADCGGDVDSSSVDQIDMVVCG